MTLLNMARLGSEYTLTHRAVVRRASVVTLPGTGGQTATTWETVFESPCKVTEVSNTENPAADTELPVGRYLVAFPAGTVIDPAYQILVSGNTLGAEWLLTLKVVDASGPTHDEVQRVVVCEAV